MIQVQRFNKVLKLAVILGDLVILNVLFISFNSIWNELFGERACSGTLPQILTLFSVCYFACTISGGVILHRRGARADQIVFRVLRNVFYFSFLSTGLMVLSELEIYSNAFLSIISFCSSSVSLSIACFSVSAYSYTEAMEEISVRSSIWEAPKI